MAAEEGKRLSRWKMALYSLLPLLLLAGVAEMVGRVVEVVRPPIPVDIGLSFSADSKLFVPSTLLPGWLMTSPTKAMPHPKTANLPEWARRFSETVPFVWQTFPLEKPTDTYRVFVVGESSVNYARVQFEDALWALAPEVKGMKVEVINAGGCGYGSRRLLLIVLEILQYSPDAVLLYVGHNESGEAEAWQQGSAVSIAAQRILWRSAAARVIRDTLAVREIRRRYGVEGSGGNAPEVKPRELEERRLGRGGVTAQMEQFRRNVDAMVAACRAKGVPIVLGSIPSNLWNPSLATPEAERWEREVRPLFAAGDYEEAVALGQDILSWAPRQQSSALENAVLREVAVKWSTPFADVEARVRSMEPNGVPGERLFVDHCHLNAEGNLILAAAYAEQVAALLPQPGGRAFD